MQWNKISGFETLGKTVTVIPLLHNEVPGRLWPQKAHKVNSSKHCACNRPKVTVVRNFPHWTLSISKTNLLLQKSKPPLSCGQVWSSWINSSYTRVHTHRLRNSLTPTQKRIWFCRPKVDWKTLHILPCDSVLLSGIWQQLLAKRILQ